jgi:hypothetical protein
VKPASLEIDDTWIGVPRLCRFSANLQVAAFAARSVAARPTVLSSR